MVSFSNLNSMVRCLAEIFNIFKVFKFTKISKLKKCLIKEFYVNRIIHFYIFMNNNLWDFLL